MIKDDFERVFKRYRTTIIMRSDVCEVLNFVQELLETEADALERNEPLATNSIARLNQAAYEIMDLCDMLDSEGYFIVLQPLVRRGGSRLT